MRALQIINLNSFHCLKSHARNILSPSPNANSMKLASLGNSSQFSFLSLPSAIALIFSSSSSLLCVGREYAAEKQSCHFSVSELNSMSLKFLALNSSLLGACRVGRFFILKRTNMAVSPFFLFSTTCSRAESHGKMT